MADARLGLKSAQEDLDYPPPQKAVDMVYKHVKENLEDAGYGENFLPSDVYLVWFSFVLGNWKALVSTTLPDDMYYEVTHSKERGVTFVDSYHKISNTEIQDEQIRLFG